VTQTSGAPIGLAVGDSLTRGSVGVSYLKFLPRGIVNKGVNGDPIMGIRRRLSRYVADPRYADVTTYILAGGSNDVLLPSLKQVSTYWRVANTIRPRLFGYRYLSEVTPFRAEYAACLDLLAAAGKRVILVGPPSPEIANLPSLRDDLGRLSESIAALADGYGAAFVDTFGLLDRTPPGDGYAWGAGPFMRVVDGVTVMTVPALNDRWSACRRLTHTIDGIHLNSAAARLVAQRIEEHWRRDQGR